MNRLYFYRSLITRIRQYLIGKGGINPVTLTNAVEDKLLQGFSITGNSQQSGTPSVESPSPIQTTELKKSSNLLDTDYFNEPKTYNGVTIQYLADEGCFLLNGTSTASSPFVDTAFLIQNANNQPFTISAFYVSGNIAIPTGAYAVCYIGKQDDSSANHINFMDAKLRQNNTNNTKICDKEYVKDFWFYITAGVVLENYKVKVSITKLENNLCDTVPFVDPSPNNGITYTNNGDGSITFNGTCTGPQSQYFLYSTTTNIPADKTKQYFCRTIYSSTGSNSTYYIEYQLYLNGTYVTGVKEYGEGGTIPANSYNYNNLRVKIYVNNGVTVDNVTVRSQIFEIPTNYEPYGKYGLEIKQEKNILDLYNAHNGQFMTVIEQSENKVVATANNATNNSPVLDLFKQLIPAGNYVLSYTVNIENTPQLQSGAGDRRNEMLIFVGGTFKTKTSSISQDGIYTQNIKFTSQSASMVRIAWYRNVVNNVVTEDATYKVTFTNVQLEQGTEASTYTPYQPPQYNRIWINRPLLGETDILTYDGTNLKIVDKEFKINLKDDVVWSYIEPTESGGIGTIKGVVNRSADLYYTILPNNNTKQSYLCTHYDSSFFDISRKHINDGTASATRNTVLTFNGLQTDYDSFMEVINTGNVEMLITYVNNRVAEQWRFTRTITSSSYIDLQPLSAGNNTLTVTNEISPTGCQYKYYSSKEN